MFDCIKANRSHLQGISDGTVQDSHLKAFQKPENLHILTLTRLTLSRFQQPLQCGERVR